MKTKLKVGDLVRVGGHARRGARRGARVEGRGPRHHIKSGTVCTVVSLQDNYVTVQTSDLMQMVGLGVVKLAKQAMRKRDEYKNRRG